MGPEGRGAVRLRIFFFEFYLLAASVLPEEAGKAAAIVIGAPQDARCDV